MFQLAVYKGVASFLTVERDAETVRLVAYVAHDLQRLARAAQVIWHRVAREEYLLDTLGKAHDRHTLLDTQLAQHLVGARQLPLAAVDDDQIRQLGPLLQQTRIAAAYDLAHRGEVVGPDHRLDIEVAILLA